MKEKKSNKKIIEKIFNILKNDKIEDKLEELFKLEKSNPEDIGITQTIGQIYLQQNKNTEALTYMKKALKINPKNFSVNYNLGRTYQKFKKFDEAIEFYKKSILYNDKFIQGFNILGDIYFNKNDLNQSVEFYKKSFNLDKTKKNIFAILRLAEIHSRMANLDSDNEMFEKAKFYYECAHNVAPKNETIIKNLIKINYHLCLYSEAIKLEKKNFGLLVFDMNSDNILIEC
tara:strand:+ start:2460 stop:3149 length:690 start_codon:yes stop_codon:yes gene_type:complete